MASFDLLINGDRPKPLSFRWSHPIDKFGLQGMRRMRRIAQKPLTPRLGLCKQRILHKTMSRKSNLSCRLDPTLLKKLQKLAGETGLTTSDLAREAIARYLGEEAPTVGDRLTRLERQVELLQNRLRLLSAG